MSRPQFTRDERAKVLADLADLVSVDRQRTEHDQSRRIWTDHVVTAFLKPFVHCLHADDRDWCLELFLDYARERAVIGSTAPYDEIEAAEASAERLLRLLLGEHEKAVA